MSIKKDEKTGTFYCVASLGFDKVTGKRIQKKRRGFKTKAEAKKAYAEIINNYSQKAYSLNSTMLFEEYFLTLFLPYYKSKVKERTYVNRLSSMKNLFSYFYKMKISEISPVDVQKWQTKLVKKYANSYVRNIYGLFLMAMNRAVVLELIVSNPAKLIGNVKKQKKEVDFWTKEEFEKVIATFYIEDFYQHFLFVSIWLMFMTGMRVGEATALLWEDIDFDKSLISVNKTLYYKNVNNFEFVEPKTRASRRLIALDDDTLKILQEWKKRQHDSFNIDYVLSYNGIPTQKHTLSYTIERHAKMAGVHRIKLHALRHSHASLLISQGKNTLLIKDRLGHEDIETTLGTYGHLYPDASYEIAKDLTGLVDVKLANKNFIEKHNNQFVNDEKRK